MVDAFEHRGHSGARIRAPRAYRCSPLSTFVVCAPCVIVGGGCCCSGARIDERARPDAAARCSTSDCITRSAWDHRALRQIDALLRFRWAPGAPRWPTVLPRAPLASQASGSRVLCVGRGPSAQGRCPQRVGRLGRAAGTAVARYCIVITLVRKPGDSAECTAATTLVDCDPEWLRLGWAYRWLQSACDFYLDPARRCSLRLNAKQLAVACEPQANLV